MLLEKFFSVFLLIIMFLIILLVLVINKFIFKVDGVQQISSSAVSAATTTTYDDDSLAVMTEEESAHTRLLNRVCCFLNSMRHILRRIDPGCDFHHFPTSLLHRVYQLMAARFQPDDALMLILEFEYGLVSMIERKAVMSSSLTAAMEFLRDCAHPDFSWDTFSNWRMNCRLRHINHATGLGSPGLVNPNLLMPYKALRSRSTDVEPRRNFGVDESEMWIGSTKMQSIMLAAIRIVMLYQYLADDHQQQGQVSTRSSIFKSERGCLFILENADDRGSDSFFTREYFLRRLSKEQVLQVRAISLLLSS
jgi:hypothetical protein